MPVTTDDAIAVRKTSAYGLGSHSVGNTEGGVPGVPASGCVKVVVQPGGGASPGASSVPAYTPGSCSRDQTDCRMRSRGFAVMKAWIVASGAAANAVDVAQTS